MTEFKKYKRKEVAELRKVILEDIELFSQEGELKGVSISDVDLFNDSPKIGDMIARNPKNHDDQWLVAEKYFNDNFEK